jgi:hypothetical protein
MCGSKLLGYSEIFQNIQIRIIPEFQPLLSATLKSVYILYYSFTDFKLSSWLTSEGLSPDLSQLPELMASKLLEDLRIAEYLQEPSCNPVLDPVFSVADSSVFL